MVTALPIQESERNAEAMLQMILNYGHIDDEGVLNVSLEGWQIDLLSMYGATDAEQDDADLEDSDDDRGDCAP